MGGCRDEFRLLGNAGKGDMANVKIIGSGGHAKVVREVIHEMGCDWPTFCFIAVGDNAARKREDLRLTRPSPVLVHPSAWVSPSAEIGAGTVVMAGAVVQAKAKIGRYVIVNTGCSVDHDAVVGDYAHIAPGAHLCGGVHVGEGALVGVCVGIEPGVKIPAWATVKREEYKIALPDNTNV